MSRRIHALLLGLGLACLAWMLYRVGWASVVRQLGALGWGLLPLVLIEGVGELFHTLGWRRCLGPRARDQSLGRLFWKRIAGSAINYFTPSAALAGEVTRASLVATAGTGAEASCGVLIDKACMALSHLIVVLVGGLFLAWRIPLPRTLEVVMLGSGAALAAGIVAFMLIQKHGRLGAVLRWCSARGWGGSPLRRLAASTSAVDAALVVFYQRRRPDVALSCAWHLAGFTTGLWQAAWFFSFVHQYPGWPVVAGVWVIGLWFDLLVFVVPMSLGTLEGSRIVTFSAVGFQAVEGMTYGMVLRFGQLLWGVIGLAGYAWLTWRKPLPGVAGVPANPLIS